MENEQTSELYVEGFLLRILDSAYLVHVQPANGIAGRYEAPANLPDWIFKSVHAIWLTQDDGSLLDRSIKGEKIKQALLQKRKSRVRVRKAVSNRLNEGTNSKKRKEIAYEH